jgi:hypothetical protein
MAGPTVPALGPCDGGFQRATAKVPLNHANPHGTQISIAVIARPGTRPGRGLGWLLFSGGPPAPSSQAGQGAAAIQSLRGKGCGA